MRRRRRGTARFPLGAARDGIHDLVGSLLGRLGRARGDACRLAHGLAALEVLAVGAALDAVIEAVEGGGRGGRGRHEHDEEEEGDDRDLGVGHLVWVGVGE